MKTILINKESKESLEILDAIFFAEGQKFLVPKWDTVKLIADEIVFTVTTSGEGVAVLGSCNQVIYVVKDTLDAVAEASIKKYAKKESTTTS